MKLKDLSNQLQISLESLQNFIFDFSLEITQCVDEKLDVTETFKKFILENEEFLKKYANDHNKQKTIQEIASEINVKPEEIIKFFNNNGLTDIDIEKFKTNISSYLIHIYIGGNYDFIQNYFPTECSFQNKSLVGYTDLFFYITDLLDPFISEDQSKLWGISKPAGVILYGPPGSGKIFWAKKIADIIGYEFVHVFKDFLVSTDSKINASKFHQFILEKMNKPKTLIFIENFDELMHKNNASTRSPEAIELINNILRHIQKTEDNEILIVGAAEVMAIIDEEIIAPGRFDLHIPIFPPSEDERAQLVLYHMMHNLVDESPLMKILKHNKAENKLFWEPVANEMKLFSNTMLIDFTQSLKKRLFTMHRKDESKEIVINEQLLKAALNEAKSKLNAQYVKKAMAFGMEAQQNVGSDFPYRLLELSAEIEHFKTKEEPIRQIGFKLKEENNNS